MTGPHIGTNSSLIPLSTFFPMCSIDSTPIGDAPWKNFRVRYTGNRPLGDPPSWMNQTYDVWYHDPRAVIKNILLNADFDGEIDYVPYHDFLEDDSRRYKDFM